MTMPLPDLLAGIPAPGRVPSVRVAGMSLDSRKLLPGEAFIALQGRREHGMQHAAAALDAGASIVLHDEQATPPVELEDRCLAVPGLERQLVHLARRLWNDPAAMLDLVAVTGTNGKSSIAWLLAQAGNGAMIGTLGIGRPGGAEASSHTTPDLPSLYRALAQLRDEGQRLVVMEASSHALDQRRLEGLSLTTAIFTNLGRDHLDYHGSLEAYGQAKARLFMDYSSERQLIDIDDPFGRTLADELAARPGRVRYGLEPDHRPDLLGRIIRADLDGLVMDLDGPPGRLRLSCGLIGRVNARNLVVVASELLVRGLRPAEVVERIAALEPVPGRMNRIDGSRGRRAVVDYAHTPDALANALHCLRELTPRRLVCVFGCGGERDAGKRPQMGRVAESIADRVVLTNDNPRGEDPIAILRQIQAGMARPDRARVIADRGAAIAAAIADCGPGDCVLVAGKGHERTQDLGDRLIEFSDLEAVRLALEEAA
jgi:UDP-N-acetylmuramoyl-L-alanyl-D-glutamate--2,6-diaminopimelate ligase